MSNTSGQAKKQTKLPYKNPLEALKDIGKGTARKTMDQIMRQYDNEEFDYMEQYEERREQPARIRTEKKTVFNVAEHRESEQSRRQIEALMKEIKEEINAIKRSDESLLSQVKDVEKMTIDSLPSKPGIYHVRFLEVVLSMLRTLRLKIGESKTWLEALMTKKQKRGSLFAHLSKKKGTQYSLSTEIQTARSVQ